MQIFDEFHDGFLDGLWTEKARNRVHIFLRTVHNKLFTVRVDGIVALNLNGFREGNVIFELSTLNGDEITPEHIEQVYEFPEGESGIRYRSRVIERVRSENLILLRISPSYGATCVALGHAVSLAESPPFLSLTPDNRQQTADS